MSWAEADANTHQDHVIAHVIGARPLAYFTHDEQFFLLLDIGFIWSILLDAQMGLLPHPVTVKELTVATEIKNKINGDIDVLLHDGERDLDYLSRIPVKLEIERVSLWTDGIDHRVLLQGIAGEVLSVTTSIQNREFEVMLPEDKEPDHAAPAVGDALDNLAASEHEYLHERLRTELGREPTEAELDEWLRRHTEAL